MDTIKECRCCTEIEEMGAVMGEEGVNCITLHPGLPPLHTVVLEFAESRLEFCDCLNLVGLFEISTEWWWQRLSASLFLDVSLHLLSSVIGCQIDNPQHQSLHICCKNTQRLLLMTPLKKNSNAQLAKTFARMFVYFCYVWAFDLEL